MADNVRVFFCEPTNTHQRRLRRMRRLDGHKCGGVEGRYCTASAILLGIVTAAPARGETAERVTSGEIDWPIDDPRWPAACAACGVPFEPRDYRFVDHDRYYRRRDTGALLFLRDAPPGACWNASWFADRERAPGDNHYVGLDGRSLVVVLPNGRQWMIDSAASNCAMPDDRAHKCWVRHGRPEDGTLHVDKNGHTCAAGGGSIDAGGWHGFLHHGELRRC